MARKGNNKPEQSDRDKTPSKRSRDIKGDNSKGAKKAKGKQPKGAGDVIKTITIGAGIVPCPGCNKRADWLNIHFPFKTPRALTPEEKEDVFQDKNLLKIYNDAFSQDITSDADNILKAVTKKLRKLIEY